MQSNDELVRITGENGELTTLTFAEQGSTAGVKRGSFIEQCVSDVRKAVGKVARAALKKAKEDGGDEERARSLEKSLRSLEKRIAVATGLQVPTSSSMRFPLNYFDDFGETVALAVSSKRHVEAGVAKKAILFVKENNGLFDSYTMYPGKAQNAGEDRVLFEYDGVNDEIEATYTMADPGCPNVVILEDPAEETPLLGDGMKLTLQGLRKDQDAEVKEDDDLMKEQEKAKKNFKRGRNNKAVQKCKNAAKARNRAAQP